MDLVTPNIGLVFWTTVTFIILLFVLGKYAWPAITSAIAKREAYIANAIRVADKANERFERIKEERASILAEAREEQNRILKEVHALKEKLIEEAKTQAQAEADKIIKEARIAIQSEKEQAMKDVKTQVATLSIGVASKVLRKNLEADDSQLELVNKILDGVKSLN